MKLKSIYETSMVGARISPIAKEQRIPAATKNLCCAVTVNKSDVAQKIKGFGCALTESAQFVLSKLSPQNRERAIDLCFGQNPLEANCYSFARTHLNSCDFSVENWNCVPQKDESLESFSFAEAEKRVMPLLSSALERNPQIQFMLSPWSPPAWMKTNNDMNHGGQLKPEYRKTWAEYFVRYIKELAKRGVNVKYVSIQNEVEAAQTWDSCKWKPEEEAEFAVKFLRPEFEKAGLGEIKILMHDHNRDSLYERFSQAMKFPGAADAIDGAAFHWYSGDQYENLRKCFLEFPKKEFVFSEGSIEGGSHPGKWYCGERYAHNIINDLNNGCTTWIDWNMVLDLQGGPNHAGNFCDAAILADTEKDELCVQNSYDYIGHFSRFIKPGAERLGFKMLSYHEPSTVDGVVGNMVEFTSFKNSDGTIALVVLNRLDVDAPFSVEFIEGEYKKMKQDYSKPVSTMKSGEAFLCPARSIQTYIFE